MLVSKPRRLYTLKIAERLKKRRGLVVPLNDLAYGMLELEYTRFISLR